MMNLCAAIVAHGQPGAPEGQQRAVEALAARIEAHLPEGARVLGATLACRGSLAALADVPVVYPLFMAEGWFTRTELPRRIAEARAGQPRVLPPLGFAPALPGIARKAALAGAARAGIAPEAATLLVVGHGSGRTRASAEATGDFARRLAGLGGFARIRTAFLEEAPFLAEAARIDGPALCLPYFATGASHVTDDIPAALAEAGFDGPLLPPVGSLPEIPALIAAALGAAFAIAPTPARAIPAARRCCGLSGCACA